MTLNTAKRVGDKISNFKYNGNSVDNGDDDDNDNGNCNDGNNFNHNGFGNRGLFMHSFCDKILFLPVLVATKRLHNDLVL